MKIQRIIFIVIRITNYISICYKYLLDAAKFCRTVIKFLYKKCVTPNKNGEKYNAGTYKRDKISDRLKQKAVECKEYANYDYYNNECMKDDKWKNEIKNSLQSNFPAQ